MSDHSRDRDVAHDHVDRLRRFNRSFTQRIGVLDPSFLQTGRSVGSARLLYDIGVAGDDGTTVLDLRRRLGLDSGYVSRLLRELERDGLIAVHADSADRRRRRVELTVAGTRAWGDLDHRSDQLAATVIAPLTATQREQLSDALDTAERLLRAATVRFDVVDPTGTAATTALTTYFDELAERFANGFDPGDTLTADAAAMTAPTGAFVIARTDDDVVGCGAVQRHGYTAEIKRMWIDARWRGLGLGRRLLRHLERTAAELGYDRVVLDTNESLDEAVAMYTRSGYTAIERYNDNPYAHHWFTKPLP